ncbi:MAG: hypothetical protein AB8G17_15665 [Gammaproteobacteria bacterium]
MTPKRSPIFLLLAMWFCVPALALEIPVGDLDRWTTLSFRNIPANTVTARGGSLEVSVARSASPLVHKLDRPVTITGVTIRARWQGELSLPDGVVQGTEGFDDFVLKVGIVEAGDQTLNWVQRRIAPAWIKRLFKLAPEGSGVKRIHFLSTTQQAALVGSERVHPLSELLFETRVHQLPEPGVLEWTYRFDEPVETLGLWLSLDGDDTASAFQVSIDQIELETTT